LLKFPDTLKDQKTLDYINNLFTDFTYLSGDRLYSEDKSIVSGIGKIGNCSFMILGNEKGHDMETRIDYNFGMAKPEGYRKSQRIMKLAEKFKLPVVSLIDTPGAYPGLSAEERGQGLVIAQNLYENVSNRNAYYCCSDWRRLFGWCSCYGYR